MEKRESILAPQLTVLDGVTLILAEHQRLTHTPIHAESKDELTGLITSAVTERDEQTGESLLPGMDVREFKNGQWSYAVYKGLSTLWTVGAISRIGHRDNVHASRNARLLEDFASDITKKFSQDQIQPYTEVALLMLESNQDN